MQYDPFAAERSYFLIKFPWLSGDNNYPILIKIDKRYR